MRKSSVLLGTLRTDVHAAKAMTKPATDPQVLLSQSSCAKWPANSALQIRPASPESTLDQQHCEIQKCCQLTRTWPVGGSFDGNAHHVQSLKMASLGSLERNYFHCRSSGREIASKLTTSLYWFAVLHNMLIGWHNNGKCVRI